MDHDQMFKHLLLRRMEDFFRLFFPDKARQLDIRPVSQTGSELLPGAQLTHCFFSAGWKACPTSEQPNCTLIRRGGTSPR